MRGSTFAAVAKLVVIIVCRNDKYNSDCQKQIFVLLKKLFQHQKEKAGRKNVHRQVIAVMLYKTMIQGVHAYKKSQRYHAPFKKRIVNNINPKHRQGGRERRQQRTVNGTYHRCGNPHFIPVQFHFHFFAGGKYTIFAILLQNINMVLYRKGVCRSLILQKFYA